MRLETDGHVIVLDPGAFTELEAVDGATAVLITHEHADHYSADHLRRTDAPIHTIGDVADVIREEAPDLAERIQVVTPGQSVDVGVPTRAVGEDHAVIHPDIPRIHNSGYLLEVEDLRIFHPGDALTVPPGDVDLLLLPVSAPWLKISECIDFGRDVGAPQALAIHDRIYSELGLGVIDGHLQRFLGERDVEYVRLEPGADLS